MHRPSSRWLSVLLPPSGFSSALRRCHQCQSSLLLPSSSPVMFSRSYLRAHSSVRTSRLVPTPRSRNDVPLDIVPAPPSAAQTARRNAAAIQATRAKRNHQQMAYNAYNTQLAQNIKQLDTWTAQLSLLATELSSTAYNRQSAGLYVPANRKYTQLTPQTLHAATAQLVKFRRTRHKVTEPSADPRLMRALAQFVRVLEMAAPAMYEGKAAGGRWRLLHHPYLYLRAVVEQWRKEGEESARAQRRRAEERREEEAIRREGGLTADDIRRRIEEVRRKRKEQPTAAKSEEDEDRRENRLLDALRGLPPVGKAKKSASASDEDSLKSQVQEMLEQEKERKRRESQPQVQEEEEPVEPVRERRKRKVPTFFGPPR